MLAIDSLAPWSPSIHELPAGCKVIQLGPDPLYQRIPVRNFRADLSLAGEIADTLTSLADAMRPLLSKHRESRDLRRARVTDAARSLRKTTRSKAEAGNGGVATKAWVSLCLSEAIAGRNATVLSELGCPLRFAHPAGARRLVSGAAFRRAGLVVSGRPWHAARQA